MPAAVTQYLDSLPKDAQALYPQQRSQNPPKTFGVYLGAFSDPPTHNQAKLLSQWDLLVLDPAQPGVLEAAAQSTSGRIVGRLDLETLVSASSSGGTNNVQALTRIIDTLSTQFKRRTDARSPFVGVLLANYSSVFHPVILNKLLGYLESANVAAYLEASPPDYLTPQEVAQIDMSLISGLVCKNGTIFPNGDRRNYFQMDSMRRAQRALAKHAWSGGSTLLMWETIDDSVELSHSIVKRSFNWCRFNTAFSWIGPKAALTDADVAVERTVPAEPLGALMWLKGNDTIKYHETWRKNDQIKKQSIGRYEAYQSMDDFLPGISDSLELLPAERDHRLAAQGVMNGDFDWSMQHGDTASNPFSISASNEDYTGLGCFQLGLKFTMGDFAGLVEGQRRLRDLKMLDMVQPKELNVMAEKLKVAYEKRSSWPNASLTSQAMKELLDLISVAQGNMEDRLRVYVGLHSGFHAGTDHQAWGLYDINTAAGTTDIYLSAKTTDRTGALLHTFLSSRNFTRFDCFLAEQSLAERTETLSKPWGLPDRVVKDIEALTPTENLLLLQRLRLSSCKDAVQVSRKVQACCEYQLLEVPSLTRLRHLNTTAYLSGEISPEELVESRLEWYRERGCDAPRPAGAVAVFRAIDAWLPGVLMRQEAAQLATLERALDTVLKKGQIDACADILALSVFCAFRKLAIEEVYLEVLDRNPMPNGAHADQAACFSEMFALGSQCEAYLDMTSNAVGRILADKYNIYYRQHQPPHRDDKSTELPTAYASMGTDEDPNAGREDLPLYYQITFLGIFAVPALVDILLLTTIGRGLYLSTYMSDGEKTMATGGLMIALLLVGGIGTWVGHGGAYYLYCMAFPAMNMFVLTRFIAGIALGLIISVGAFIVLSVIRSPYEGFIFVFYFLLLSTYLTMLATLAIYQFPGFQFQSGRMTIVMCIPLLFISPIITLWIGNDIIVYPCVLSGFLILLTFGARNVFSNWNNWYLEVPIVSDTEVVNWYTQQLEVTGEKTDLPEGVTDLAATPLPRKALMDALVKERGRHSWQKSTSDEFVRKLAKGHDATLFLMDWYCKYSRTKMPYPYSPTWNLQCKAGVDTLKDMQKGLKLHNAFIHWRHGGAEVWCGVLYFVVALMDKWVALLTGSALVGLSAASSDDYRLSVGFGLGYYLVAAVCLDAVATPLWPKANKRTDQPITSLDFLREAAVRDAKARRSLYWRNFAKFFFMHIWGLAVVSALMWIFEDARNAVIMFICYVVSYTGLLWYQYNRIYTGALAMGDLIIAAVAGLTVGLVLHEHAQFEYSSVLALGISSWTAAILSMRTAKIGWPTFETKKSKTGANSKTFYSAGSLAPYPDFSERQLKDTFDAAIDLPEDSRFRVDPTTHPGVEVMELLRMLANTGKSSRVRAAFPLAERLTQETVGLWQSGRIVVDLVPARHLFEKEEKMRTISRDTGDLLHIIVLVGNEQQGNERMMDIRRNCKVIAESIMQATTEARFGMSYDQSILAEILAVEPAHGSGVSIPEGVKRQLEWSASERLRVVKNADQELLRYLLLGLDCDRDWDLLPRFVRSFLMKRACGDPCAITHEQLGWISSTFCADDSLVLEHLARCNLGATLTSMIREYARTTQIDFEFRGGPEPLYSDYQRFIAASQKLATDSTVKRLKDRLMHPALATIQALRFSVKFFVVSIVADPEFQRELDYVIRDKSFIIRWPARFILNGIWNYVKLLQRLILPFFLFYGRPNVSALYNLMQGTKTTIEKKRIVIDSLQGPSTGFFKPLPAGGSEFHLYSGRHEKQPESNGQLKFISTYTKDLVLLKKEEYWNQTISNIYEYEYSQAGHPSGLNIPLSRNCIKGDMNGQTIHYDNRGYITSGSYLKDGNLVDFKFQYRKNAKYDDELLRAEFNLAHINMKISWSVPPPKHSQKLDTWLPYTKVTEATYTQGTDVWHSKWTYDHRSHPTIETTCNGDYVDTPPMILYDWFGILKKPNNCSFLADNPLFSFRSMHTSLYSRLLGFNVKRYPVSTGLKRTHLWQAWKSGKEFDAITARWLDENLLRSDQILRPYWTGRDLGLLRSAAEYLESQADAIMARTDIDPDVSAWSSLAYKYGDLLSFGQGGDCRINTRSQATQIQDSDDVLHVLAMDTGTWPNEGGGVSACRRDMVNDLNSIRWHVVAENANDYGVPKFQIEKNVQSLSVLPLWGLDFLTPTHGVFEDFLDSAVQQRSNNTSNADIKKNFLPILQSLVRCARAIRFDRQHIEESSQALLDLNSYFESDRHWGEVWNSDIVKEYWRELWLAEDVENARPISEWLDPECPTLLHLDTALDMWHRYLFIFSIPVPERIPDVFQASHHFTGASYGVLCKIKRNCTLHVWDHCISWREVTVFLSSAMSFDSPFVCTSLIHLSRMASTLILHYADVVLPCADFFNPGWEVEHGTQEGILEHRRTFARKIDPVVNGICNMEKFKPIEKIKSKVPTVTMLSHVRFVKDIKNALLAADIIVNEWGFKDYQLDIYGDMEKAPAYSVECKEILASKGLRDHVALKGLGNPSKVLEEAWIFLNSSISEGLPLAMGEAALTGVPVVCTDVGASFRVVSDPVTFESFSEVIAPNDSYSLAKAQVNILGLLDKWSEWAEDEPGYKPKLSLHPSREEVAMIQQRMYDKSEQRRKLGMMGRNNVLSSFSSDRYLREHEQLLWIGKAQSPRYLARSKQPALRSALQTPNPSTYHLKLESPSPRILSQSRLSTAAPSVSSFRLGSERTSYFQVAQEVV